MQLVILDESNLRTVLQESHPLIVNVNRILLLLSVDLLTNLQTILTETKVGLKLLTVTVHLVTLFSNTISQRVYRHIKALRCFFQFGAILSRNLLMYAVGIIFCLSQSIINLCIGSISNGLDTLSNLSTDRSTCICDQSFCLFGCTIICQLFVNGFFHFRCDTLLILS